MNIVQRVVSGLASSVGLQASTMTPEGDRGWGGPIGHSTSGVYVDEATASQHWAVRACRTAMSGPISTLPLQVFERLDGDRRRVAREHPIYRILHSRPNRRQTAQEFREDQEGHLSWWRNAYAIIRPAEDGYPVGELDPVHPSRVQDVKRGSDGWVYYWINRQSPAVGCDVYREDEILHIRRAPLTRDGLRGVPVWETDRETLGRAMAVEQFGALFFANGGSGGGVLSHPGTFKTKEDERDFVETWRSGGTGANRHKDRLLKHGVTYKANEVKNDESQFLETKKQCGYEVAAIWNMPPHRVGMLERATNNNIAEQGIEYVVYCLGPDITAWEQALSRDLLIGDDADRYFIEFNVAGFLRGDITKRWEAYARGRQWGWLSINDVRRLENMDPIGAAGDDYLTPINMAPAGAAPPNGGKTDNPSDKKDDPNA